MPDRASGTGEILDLKYEHPQEERKVFACKKRDISKYSKRFGRSQ
jgi:hypothetical protein